MNKVINNVRVTELDGLSDTIVRLYKDNPAAAKDAFVAATMADVERLSAEITTAILQDKALSTLEAADSERDKAIVALGKVLTRIFRAPDSRNAGRRRASKSRSSSQSTKSLFPTSPPCR